MKRKNKKFGFTLIELLVVISIIAILMAIMMPALRKAREQALKIVCGSRQKDIGLAFNLYAQDWGGKLPRAYWDENDPDNTAYTRLPYKLAPYYNKDESSNSKEFFSFEMYSCPAQPKWIYDSDGDQVESGTAAVGSYGYNYFFFYGVNPGGKFDSRENWIERDMADIKDGAKLPLYGCVSGERYQTGGSYIGGGGGQVLAYSGPHPMAIEYGFMSGKSIQAAVSNTHRSGPAPNHGGDCNMLMGDFHVEPVDVCIDGEFPWIDYRGTAFHPSRASKDGNEKR